MKYNVTAADRCPNCKKKVHNMMKEHGMIITIPFGIVCSSCGAHFAIIDMIRKVFEAKDSKILVPGAEVQDEALLIKIENPPLTNPSK